METKTFQNVKNISFLLNRIFIFIIFQFVSKLVIGQSPIALENIGLNSVKNGPHFKAPINPWFGAQVGYMFGNNGDFSDNMLASAQVHYSFFKSSNGRSAIPVIANIGSLRSSINKDSLNSLKAKFNDLISSDRGLHFGLYPYRILKSNEKYYTVIYGMISGKLNSYKTEEVDKTEKLFQFRTGIGFEIGFGQVENSNKKQFVFSISPIVVLMDKEKYNKIFNENKSSIFTIESSIVYALSGGIGLMIEANLMNAKINPLKAGLIYSFEGKDKN